jgi:predicted DCC family thiol-disulfide oxidoreductase YuxK
MAAHAPRLLSAADIRHAVQRVANRACDQIGQIGVIMGGRGKGCCLHYRFYTVRAAYRKALHNGARMVGLEGRGTCPILLFMENETQVLYNQSCPICRAEIDAYRKRAERDGLPLRFDTMDRAADWGLTSDQAAKRLHVMQNGVLLSGLPAFRALWSQMPHLRWLARVTGWPVIGPVAVGVYDRILAPMLFAAHKRRMVRGR